VDGANENREADLSEASDDEGGVSLLALNLSLIDIK
jgi:hypothetical protein